MSRIRPDLAEALRQIDWGALPDQPGATLVKSAENRDVWRLDVAETPVFAKCYRRAGLLKRLVDRVRGSAAEREFTALRLAAEAGILVPEPLGVARRPAAGGPYEAILITVAMPLEPQSLDEAWLEAAGRSPNGRAGDPRRMLIDALAELLAKAHAAGLYHGDLHVRNILVLRCGETVRLAMVDLHNHRRRRRLSVRSICKNLVQLNQWFRPRASRTDRLRFVRRYCHYLRGHLSAQGRPVDGLYDYKTIARKVLHKARRHAARLYARRDRRILRDGKYFGCVRLGDRWTACAALQVKHGRPYRHRLTALPDKAEWRQLLAQANTLIDSGEAHVLKASGARRVLQIELPYDGEPWSVVVKCFRARGAAERIAGWLGRDRLRREFLLGWRLLHRDLPVALPLAILTRTGPFRCESRLLVEYVGDSHDLDTLTKLHLPDMPRVGAIQLKRCIGAQLASVLRRLWECGFVHRDLKAANIRVQMPADGSGSASIVLVDVTGIRRPLLASRKTLLRSLARLDASLANSPAVTRTDRLRVLLAVLRGVDGAMPDWKSAWRQIETMSRRDQARKAQLLPWLQPAVSSGAAR